METLYEATVLRVGGWDARYTKVLVIAECDAECDDLAIAVLDADTDLNLDDFERDSEGAWQAGAASGSAAVGPGMQGRVVYDFGQAAPGTLVTVDCAGAEHTVVS